MYSHMPLQASHSAKIPDLQIYVFASLQSEDDQSCEDRDAGVVWCPACGCRNLHLIATGTHERDVLTLLSGDGTHIVGGMPVNADGSAIVTVFTCENGRHVVVERTRFAKGHCYRDADVYPVDGPVGSQLVELARA